MQWKNLKIGTKLSLGFGSIIILLLIVSANSYRNFHETKTYVDQALLQEERKGFLLEKEIDHLKWMGTLSDLFLKDEVCSVQVETDDHKCGLGKWLYSDEDYRTSENR